MLFCHFGCSVYEENCVICCYYCKSLEIKGVPIIFNCEVTCLGLSMPI